MSFLNLGIDEEFAFGTSRNDTSLTIVQSKIQKLTDELNILLKKIRQSEGGLRFIESESNMGERAINLAIEIKTLQGIVEVLTNKEGKENEK